jgi:hypothetical protein
MLRLRSGLGSRLANRLLTSARPALDIEVAFPLVGPVIRYSGWLAADAPEGARAAAGSEIAAAS